MRGRPYTCCFTGHRPEKLPWGDDETDGRCAALKKKLQDAVEAAYDEGMRHFICGMARCPPLSRERCQSVSPRSFMTPAYQSLAFPLTG